MTITSEKELTHKPFKEEIFDALHLQIIAGRYAPGDWLRQEEIASQMGVSMTPVREALDLLVAAGLAERVPYRGVRVPEMSPKEVVEAYGLRLLLEVEAAREAALHITPEQVSALTRTLNEMKKHTTLDEISQSRLLSRRFHMSIVEASGNKLLTKLYALVASAFPDWLLYESVIREPELLGGSMEDDLNEHLAIVDALANGDVEKVTQRSIEHLLLIGQDMEKMLNIPPEILREKEKQVLHLIKRSK